MLQLVKKIYRKINPSNTNDRVSSSFDYWNKRYRDGGNSGAGSYGILAQYKAGFINAFVEKNHISSVMEFGCGDGAQLTLANYPQYKGYDVSIDAVNLCKEKFANDATKSFGLVEDYSGEKADMAISLDVLYHLLEDAVFEKYLHTLFNASNRYVVIYSSNCDDNRGYEGGHVKHRLFKKWIDKNIRGWDFVGKEDNPHPYTENDKSGSFADFYIYEKQAG